MLGNAAEDYIKCVYKLSQEKDSVSPSNVAEQLGISAAAVTKMVKRLKELNIINYERTQGIELTSAGEQIALEILRHHRLIELYLYEALGYTWDEVHEEADRLEHVISLQFANKIDEYLGFPTHDPHGAPIPDKDGCVENVRYPTLVQLEPGQEATIQQVNNDDASMLRYLGDMGMYPGAEIQVVAVDPFGGPIHLQVAGMERVIGRELAGHVMVLEKEKAG